LFTIGGDNGAMNKRIQSSTMAIANTFAFSGIEAVPVEVQVQIAPGAPGLVLVGLPDKAVGEARERVRAAFNLKPAESVERREPLRSTARAGPDCGYGCAAAR
jgi:hypothetical protein